MTDKLQKAERPGLPTAELRELGEKANELLEASLSPNTRKAYTSRWRSFTKWAKDQGLSSNPANESTSATVALFIAHLVKEGRKVSTIEQYTAAIAGAYKAMNLEPPTRTEAIRKLLRGVRNTVGAARDKKKAITLDELRAMANACDPTLVGRRDRAMLLIGFLGALRRSELVGIRIEHIEPIDGGIRILIPRSKTDQAGHGRRVTLPRGGKLCPVKALHDWLEGSGISSGPLFRRTYKHRVGDSALSSQMVPLVVKKYAKEVGLDIQDFSGHSLRSGFVTTAANNGARDHEIMNQTGHKNVQTLHGYKQANKGLEGNPASQFDLS